ncbi:MAG: winged helix-turn-helix domain-containing protein, partial [Candidatus Aenigmatarchaeota archaeon]
RGAGKSRLLQELALKLALEKKSVILLKLGRESLSERARHDSARRYFNLFLVETILEDIKKNRDMWTAKLCFETMFQKHEDLKKLLSGELEDSEARRVIALNLSLLKNLLGEQVKEKLDAVLIDLPDYPRKSYSRIMRDMDEVQDFWRYFLDKKMNINILITLQEETFDPKSHFIFGKMLFYRIEAFQPSQLVSFVKQNFESPFNDEALFLLARAAGGNIRKFKILISRCLEQRALEQSEVNKIISTDEITLINIFKKEEHRELATRIIKLMTEKPGISQREMARALGVSESKLSRILKKIQGGSSVHLLPGQLLPGRRCGPSPCPQ